MQEPKPGTNPAENEQATEPGEVVSNRDQERGLEVERLRHEWRHSRLIVTGPALYAALIDGEGERAARERVKEVDVVLTTREQLPDRMGWVDQPDDLGALLESEEYRSFSEWVRVNGYEGCRVNVLRQMERDVPYKEAVRNGPKLQLWQELLPKADHDPFLGPHRAVLEQSHRRMLEDELAREPVMPERLSPNGTLARALVAMEWAEMLGLDCDDTLLRNADKLARAGKLILSNVNQNDDGRVLDPAFVERSARPGVMRALRRERDGKQYYHELSRVAEEVYRAGGVEAYIGLEFGKAYIEGYKPERQRVRLDDIKLAQSPRSLEEQREFLKLWRGLPERFKASAPPSKESEDSSLPRPDKLAGLIDLEKAEQARAKRREQSWPLEAITGTYTLHVASNEPQARAKAEAYVRVMGYDNLEQATRPPESPAQTLIRLGVHSKNPVLAELTARGPHEVRLVVSAELEDMLQASLEKDWTSCVDLENGHYADGLYEDHANGAVVAYVMKGENRFLGRMIIRAGETMGEESASAAAIEVLYGDDRYNDVAREALEAVIRGSGVRVGEPMRTPPYRDEVWFDSADEVTADGRHIYYLESDRLA
jgi:hypothetical protein